MKCYSLYVGTRNHQEGIDAVDDERIAATTSAVFESFTVLHGYGWFRGQREDVRMIKIATDDEERVSTLAENLRQLMEQDGVGLECDGLYRRITTQHQGRPPEPETPSGQAVP